MQPKVIKIQFKNAELKARGCDHLPIARIRFWLTQWALDIAQSD